jgi:hypothetical protein
MTEDNRIGLKRDLIFQWLDFWLEDWFKKNKSYDFVTHERLSSMFSGYIFSRFEYYLELWIYSKNWREIEKGRKKRA